MRAQYSKLATAIVLMSTFYGCAASPAQNVSSPTTEQLFFPSPSSFWWKELGSENLNHLVSSARKNAFSVLQASAELAEAEAISDAKRAPLIPSIGLNASNQSADINNSASLSLDLDWKADVFGQYRDLAKASNLETQASRLLVEDAKRLVTFEVVSTYISYLGALAEIHSAKESSNRLNDTILRVKRLTAAGIATQLDLHRSETQKLDADARISQLLANAKQLENKLLLLTNENSIEFSSSNILDTVLVAPVELPTPTSLIKNRPDIRAADLKLQATAKEVAASQKKLLPNLSLDARLFMTEDDDISFSISNFTSSIISRLAMPILGRGKLLADIDANNARLQQSRISYDQIARTALLEIDTAFTQVTVLRRAALARSNAAQSAKTALKQSQRLFQAGEIAYLDVLIAEQSLSDAERDLQRASREAGLAWATLQAALATN